MGKMTKAEAGALGGSKRWKNKGKKQRKAEMSRVATIGWAKRKSLAAKLYYASK